MTTATQLSVAVDKSSFMVGSYGPKAELQSYITPREEAPSGMLARGTYTMKSLFTDDDKMEHLKWEWKLEIKKDWEWINVSSIIMLPRRRRNVLYSRTEYVLAMKTACIEL